MVTPPLFFHYENLGKMIMEISCAIVGLLKKHQEEVVMSKMKQMLMEQQKRINEKKHDKEYNVWYDPSLVSDVVNRSEKLRCTCGVSTAWGSDVSPEFHDDKCDLQKGLK